MTWWERSPGFPPLPTPIQGVVHGLFFLFLFHPPQPPQRPLPLRLWLRQHLPVPSGCGVLLRLQPPLPLRDWVPLPPTMASPAGPAANPAPVLVFDGGCPFCRHFAEVSELRSGIAGLTIVDGRADGPLRQSLATRGYHLRDGAMVLVGDRVLHGAGAVAWLCAQMQPSPGLLQLLAAVLADPARSRATYPLLLAARRFALSLKRLPIDPDLS